MHPVDLLLIHPPTTFYSPTRLAHHTMMLESPMEGVSQVALRVEQTGNPVIRPVLHSMYGGGTTSHGRATVFRDSRGRYVR